MGDLGSFDAGEELSGHFFEPDRGEGIEGFGGLVFGFLEQADLLDIRAEFCFPGRGEVIDAFGQFRQEYIERIVCIFLLWMRLGVHTALILSDLAVWVALTGLDEEVACSAEFGVAAGEVAFDLDGLLVEAEVDPLDILFFCGRGGGEFGDQSLSDHFDDDLFRPFPLLRGCLFFGDAVANHEVLGNFEPAYRGDIFDWDDVSDGCAGHSSVQAYPDAFDGVSAVFDQIDEIGAFVDVDALDDGADVEAVLGVLGKNAVWDELCIPHSV